MLLILLQATEDNVSKIIQTPEHDSDELDFELGVVNVIDFQIELESEKTAGDVLTAVITATAASENEDDSNAEYEMASEFAANENAAIENELDAGCADDQDPDEDCIDLLLGQEDDFFREIDDPKKR